MCGAPLKAPSPKGGRPRRFCSNRCRQAEKWQKWREKGGFVSENTEFSAETQVNSPESNDLESEF